MKDENVRTLAVVRYSTMDNGDTMSMHDTNDLILVSFKEIIDRNS